MIIEHRGDLLTVTKGILVHGCNSHGVMGSGIAWTIRNRFPRAYDEYRRQYELNSLKVGQVVFHRHAEDIIIANAITQKDAGRDPNVVYVDYEGLRECFHEINAVAHTFNLPVHFPLIGCGLANGKWERVAEIIEEAMPDPTEKHLWIYEPTPVVATDEASEGLLENG